MGATELVVEPLVDVGQRWNVAGRISKARTVNPRPGKIADRAGMPRERRESADSRSGSTISRRTGRSVTVTRNAAGWCPTAEATRR
jgi:hypothetical protein